MGEASIDKFKRSSPATEVELNQNKKNSQKFNRSPLLAVLQRIWLHVSIGSTEQYHAFLPITPLFHYGDH